MPNEKMLCTDGTKDIERAEGWLGSRGRAHGGRNGHPRRRVDTASTPLCAGPHLECLDSALVDDGLIVPANTRFGMDTAVSNSRKAGKLESSGDDFARHSCRQTQPP